MGRTSIPGSWITSYGSAAYFHTGGDAQYSPCQIVPLSLRSEDTFSYTGQPAHHHAQSFPTEQMSHWGIPFLQPTEKAQVVGEPFVQHQISDVAMSPGVPAPPGTT